MRISPTSTTLLILTKVISIYIRIMERLNKMSSRNRPESGPGQLLGSYSAAVLGAHLVAPLSTAREVVQGKLCLTHAEIVLLF